MNSFYRTPLDEIICQYVFPLLTGKGNQAHVMGTMTMVSPGFGVTAKHVIEECQRQYDGGTGPPAGDHEAGFGISAYQFKDGKIAAEWAVTKVYLSPLTDIAFLKLSHTNSPPEMAQLILDVHPPKVGESIDSFGYPNGRVEFGETLRVIIQSRTSTGVVRAHYRRPFPRFCTDQRIDHGMSGGPAFNSAGRLCGIASSSLPPSNSEDEHSSFFSMLWPSLTTEVDLPRQGMVPGDRYMVYELGRHDLIKVHGIEMLSIENGEIHFRHPDPGYPPD